jgi:fructose-bisphosphate aldolase, class II
LSFVIWGLYNMLVSPIELYKKAKKEGYAIGAFNTSDLNITKAIIQAAEELESPVIIETSEGEINFLGAETSAAEVVNLAKGAKVPVVLHLDHGKSFETVEAAIKAGYTSIHLDGSSLPLTENLELTQKAVALAHKNGIPVEAEIGHIAGGSELHKTKIEISPDTLTEPAEAAEFARATKVDVLAVAIGNIHGMYSNPPQLDFERLAEITNKVKTFFSLHGGSGIPARQVKKAIKMGIIKVNVNTEIRLAFHQGLLHEFEVNPDEVIPYKYLPAGTEAVEKVIKAKIRMFGSAGKAK